MKKHLTRILLLMLFAVLLVMGGSLSYAAAKTTSPALKEETEDRTRAAKSDLTKYNIKVVKTYSISYAILKAINAERTKAGVPALKMDQDLLEDSMFRSGEIHFSFSHIRPDNTTCFSLNSKMDAEIILANVIDYADDFDITPAMDLLMKGENRSLLLSGSYKSIGIGVTRWDGLTYCEVLCLSKSAAGTDVSGSSFPDGQHSVTVWSTSKYAWPYYEEPELTQAYFTFFEVRPMIKTPELDLGTLNIANTFTITCSDPDAVEWWENGVVHPLKGDVTVTFTATSTTNPSLSTSLKVHILPAIDSIAVSPTSLSMAPGSARTLSVKVTPSYAPDHTVTWKSSNRQVATVDANGKVTAKAPGTAVITATSKDGGRTATCRVAVDDPSAKVSVTKVTLNKASLVLLIGKSETLKATVAPSNATNKGVTWSSSDTSVASVSSTGKVTAKKMGTATITVTTKDGKKTASCKVTVKGEGIVCASARTYAAAGGGTNTGTVPEGSEVEIYKKTDGWWRIKYNGKLVWIESHYIYDKATKTPKSSDRVGQGVTTRKVTVYTLPTTTSKQVSTLPAERIRNLYAQCGNWYQIYTNGKYAWVRCDGFDYTKAANVHNIGTAVMKKDGITYYGQGYDYVTSVSLKKGQAVNLYKVYGNWYLVYRSGHFLWLNKSVMTQYKMK